MPSASAEHLQAAFAAMRWAGWSYEAALQDPVRGRILKIRAAQMCTAQWAATQRRSVVPVKRVRLGCDGHPVAWCTQMAPGPLVAGDLLSTQGQA